MRDSVFLLAIAILTIAGCATRPVNLSVAKNEVQNYYESGKYDEELDEIISSAENEFNKVSADSNSVIIFDVDDTALNNFEISKKIGFGFVYNIIEKWVMDAKAPAIPQVKDLYDFVIDKDFKVIFLTGRKDFEYEATYKNLTEQGYTSFDTLIVRNKNEYKQKAVEFKSMKRKELTKKGYKIVGTVGDQWSDLEGEYHGIQVKIPNYIYLIED